MLLGMSLPVASRIRGVDTNKCEAKMQTFAAVNDGSHDKFRYLDCSSFRVRLALTEAIVS